MQCAYCNSEMPEGVKYCAQCGSPIEADQPAHSGFKPLQAKPVVRTEPIPVSGSINEVLPLPEQIKMKPAAQHERVLQTVLAIVSLAIGVMSFCGWVFPKCGVPITIVGMALGFLGQRKSPSSLGKAGMALCGLGFAVTLLFSILDVSSRIGHLF
jgi:hypothetical protein